MPGKQGGTVKPLKQPKKEPNVVDDDTAEFKKKQREIKEADENLAKRLTKKKK